LVDLDRFQLGESNYKLTFENAMKGNLLGLLAGDFMVKFQGGLAMQLSLKTIETLQSDERQDNNVTEIVARIDDACFVNPSGERINTLGPGLWPLFLATDHEEDVVVTEEGYLIKYVISPDVLGCWTHVALTTLIAMQEGMIDTDVPFPWRNVLRTQKFPVSITDIAVSASEGIQKGLVRYVIHQHPDITPAFLLDVNVSRRSPI
jgi:hypothetical protein